MSFSQFFINRPIFAGVISIIITLAGLIASQVLPVAQYPEIAPPTVVINASYPGASALESIRFLQSFSAPFLATYLSLICARGSFRNHPMPVLRAGV